jgi:hypothetical protein
MTAMSDANGVGIIVTFATAGSTARRRSRLDLCYIFLYNAST